MRHIAIQTHPELPVAQVPVCEACNGLAQAPSIGCEKPHGTAHVMTVLRHLCKLVGHVLTCQGHPTMTCLRCRRPRWEVVC